MRAIVGRPFGWMLAIGFPMVFNNALVGQNGLPHRGADRRHALSDADSADAGRHLPRAAELQAAIRPAVSDRADRSLAMDGVFHRRGVALALASWLAFGAESWQAFFHWMPMFSQAFLTEGKRAWWKLQSMFSLVRYLGGTEQLGWAFQWVLTAGVAVVLVLMWRSRVHLHAEGRGACGRHAC
jgi:arabinofuranan 3-O-arabinosyltransferase